MGKCTHISSLFIYSSSSDRTSIDRFACPSSFLRFGLLIMTSEPWDRSLQPGPGSISIVIYQIQTEPLDQISHVFLGSAFLFVAGVVIVDGLINLLASLFRFLISAVLNWLDILQKLFGISTRCLLGVLILVFLVIVTINLAAQDLLGKNVHKRVLLYFLRLHQNYPRHPMLSQIIINKFKRQWDV